MSQRTSVLMILVILFVVPFVCALAQGTPPNVKVNSDTSPYLQNEEQIWISPNDANIVIAVWRDWRLGYRRVGVGVSTSQGLIWDDSLFTDTPYEKHSDPCLTGDQFGNFYACMLNYTGGTNDGMSLIVVYKSTDNGTSWSGPVPTSVIGDYFEDKQFTTIDRTGGTYNGNYYVSWTRFPNPTRILFVRSTDGIASFDDTVTVGPSPYYEDCGGYIDAGQFSIPIVHSGGDVHVFWQHYDIEPGCTGTPAIMHVISTDGGQTFSEPEVAFHNNFNYDYVDGGLDVYGMPNGDCDISGGPYDGTIYISQCQYDEGYGDTEVTVRKSTDNGQTWTDRQVVNDDPPGQNMDQFHPWLVVNEDGVILLIFYDQRDDPSHTLFNSYFSASFDGGETYIQNMRISDVSIDPSLAKSGTSAPTYREVVLDNGMVDMTQRQLLEPMAGLFAEYIGVHANHDTVSTIWTDTRNGNQDAYSARFLIPFEFTKPRLYLPEDLSTVVTNPVEFVWATCWHEDLDKYQLQITDDPTFSTVDYDYQNITDNHFTIPVDLSNGTWYWRIHAERTSDFMSTEVSDVYQFTFDLIPGPVVVGTSPAANAQGVVSTTNVTATFDTDIDPSTITADNFVVNGSLSGRQGGTITYDNPSRTATFDPDNDFFSSEKAEVTLTTNIKSSVGVNMVESYTWMFTVQAGTGVAEYILDANYHVGTQPTWVTGGDFDGDGDIDLMVAMDEADSVAVLLNDGTGSFDVDSIFHVGAYPNSVATADFDGDGILDLVTADGDLDAVYTMSGNGDGTFTPIVAYFAGDMPWTVVTADLNGDGYPDIACTNYNSHDVTVILNDGDGTFGTHVEYPLTDWSNPIGLCSGDFDGDADIDLATGGWSGEFRILLNDGNGQFSTGVSLDLGDPLPSICTADFDHDNDLDLAVAKFVEHKVSVLYNDGNASFTPGYEIDADASTVCVHCADLDGDNYSDIIAGTVSLPDTDSLKVFLNDGFGTFPIKDNYATGDSPYGIFAADFDGDGDLDMATANYESDDVSILLNEVSYTTGDADGNGIIEISDAVHLINYVFVPGSPAPEPLAAGDCDCNEIIEISDAVLLISYVFVPGSPAPGDPDGDGTPDC